MRKRKTERGSGRSSGYFPKLKKQPEKRARKLKQKNNNKKNLQKENETKQETQKMQGVFKWHWALSFEAAAWVF